MPKRLHPFLLALAFLAFLASAAYAEEPQPEPGPGPLQPPTLEEPGAAPEAEVAAEEESAGMTSEDLEDWILESPAAVRTMLGVKFGSAAIGLLLLVLLWVRWERVRVGVLPAPEPITATTPFPLSTALMILGGALVSVVLGGMVLAQASLDEGSANAAGMLVTQGLLLGAAALVILRRRQLGAGPRRSPTDVTARAFAAFFIACALVIPVMMLNVLILQWVGHPLTVYKPVEEVIRGSGTSRAWVITVLAAVLAPVAEESLFRGMLYPAIRSSLPRLKHAALFSAVLTSAIFALMHPHPPSWLPLFALAMVLTWIFERTNSLAAVIGAHALWNISTLLPLLIRGMA